MQSLADFSTGVFHNKLHGHTLPKRVQGVSKPWFNGITIALFRASRLHPIVRCLMKSRKKLNTHPCTITDTC
jgi:hypothetical protein